MLDIWVGYTCSGIILLFRWNRQVLYFYWCMDRLFMCWIYWILIIIIGEFHILTYFSRWHVLCMSLIHVFWLGGWQDTERRLPTWYVRPSCYNQSWPSTSPNNGWKPPYVNPLTLVIKYPTVNRIHMYITI